MRRALIDKDGLVLNVIEIEADSDWKPSKGQTLLTEEQSQTASPGDSWDGQTFVRPEPIVMEPTEFQKLEARVKALEDAKV